MVFENVVDETANENRMDRRCYETFNNMLYCCQASFNITVNLGQLSYCNNMLKDQFDMRKDVQSAQSKVSNEEYVIKPRLREKSNDCMQNKLDDSEVIR